jgi:uncharacterized integral membrane protein
VTEANDKNLLSKTNFRLWRSWTIFCSLGEIFGIAIAAITARLIWLFIGEPSDLAEKVFVLISMIIAGSLEGLTVGYFQWHVLRGVFPTMKARFWIKPTVLVAALGWFLGMLPSTFFTANQETAAAQAQPDLPLVWTIIFAALMGLIVGAIFGAAQWFVLRRFVKNAGLWIIGNAVGWSVALIWIFIAASLPDEETSLANVLILGGIGGLLSGLSVGAVTGYFLLRIFSQKES